MTAVVIVNSEGHILCCNVTHMESYFTLFCKQKIIYLNIFAAGNRELEFMYLKFMNYTYLFA